LTRWSFFFSDPSFSGSFPKVFDLAGSVVIGKNFLRAGLVGPVKHLVSLRIRLALFFVRLGAEGASFEEDSFALAVM